MDGDRDIVLNRRLSGGLSGPARVGAELRGVREEFGWRLSDIAAGLKIRLGFLEAIENGDLAALPAPAYAAGFIRSYAEALRLDPDEILRRFRAEGMTETRAPTLAFPEAARDRGVPPGAIALVLAVIAIGGYALWYGHSEHKFQAAHAVPPTLAPLALPKPVPLKTAAKPAPVLPAPRSSKPHQPAAHDRSRTLPSGPVIVPLPEVVPKPSIAAAPLSPPAAEPATPAQATGAAAFAQPNTLKIMALSHSWIQIRDVQGKILFSRVLHHGQSWTLPDQPGLTLTTGNAGGLELIRNGISGAPLGPFGFVLHNALITPSGTIVPPPPPFEARHVYYHHRRPVRRYRPINPFSVTTTGEQ